MIRLPHRPQFFDCFILLLQSNALAYIGPGMAELQERSSTPPMRDVVAEAFQMFDMLDGKQDGLITVGMI